MVAEEAGGRTEGSEPFMAGSGSEARGAAALRTAA